MTLLLAAPALRSVTVGEEASSVIELGSNQIATGSATYALNQALTGTTSSAIDLGLYGGLFFSVTSTGAPGGGNNIYLQTSGNNSTWSAPYNYPTNRDYWYPKRARYLRFYTNSNATPTAKSSVWYYLPGGIPTTASAGAAQSVTLSAINGTAATSYYDKLTQSSAAIQVSTANIDSINQSTIAPQTNVIAAYAQFTYESLSRPVVSLTAGYAQLITFAAGVTGPCEFCIGGTGATGANAALLWQWSNSPVPPAAGGWNYWAITTTPVCKKDLYPNTYLHMSVTAAGLSVTAAPNFSVKH